MMKRWLLFLLLAAVLCIPVGADTEDLYAEQWEASGADQLIEQCPAQTYDRMQEMGFDQTGNIGDTKEVYRVLWDMVRQELSSPLKTAVSVLAIILLNSVLAGIGKESPSLLVGAVSTLAGASAVVIPIASSIERVGEAVDAAVCYMTCFAPVYAGVMVSAGQPATAVTFQSVLLTVCEIFSWLIRQWILPLSVSCFALGLCSAVSNVPQLDRFSSFLQKNTTFILTALMTVFIGILSLKSITDIRTDELSARVVRFSAANVVPVVGGSVAESLNTVRGCLESLKGTVGTFGVTAGILILLPPAAECLLYHLLLSFCSAVSECFASGEMTKLLKTTTATIKMLMAVVTCLSVFLVLVITIVAQGGGR